MKPNNLGVLTTILLCGLLQAQGPTSVDLTKSDTAETKALIEKAKKIAGPMWAQEEHYFCEVGRADQNDAPVIAPMKIFDKVWIIGNADTVVFVVQTSAGLLMFDSLEPNQTDTQLLPGLQKLGLNPADVKVIVLGHGHANQFGGARYMQDHYGTKVYLAAADWNTLEHPPAARGGGGGRAQQGPPPAIPKHDADVKDGEPIVLGDLKVMPYGIPGHTPGSMAYIFPVKDNGKTHMAGFMGGAVLLPNIQTEGLDTYLKAIRRYAEESKKAKVDVLMMNHPTMYDLPKMLDQLAARKKGDPNPFIVGQANYQKFVSVMESCTEVNIARGSAARPGGIF